ncbi:glycosyl transferase family 8 [Gilliamella sp. Nev5-1]|nr:glycosyltransferase family 8 protein [Gilliamella apicola]OCG66707.1 glycosyl transferase family 8 [Gilliamella apicola]
MNSRINIAYCTDSNYLEHVGVSITSIMLNNMHNNIHFHVFLYDVSPKDQQKLQKISPLINIYIIPFEELAKYKDHKSNKITHINRSMYIRLSVPKLLYGKIDKFIYLDADTLCFSDISPILNINIDSVICAVTPDSLDKQNMLKNKERLELASESYFNSGFLYININNWIGFDTENKANKTLLSAKKERLIYPDQDVLNIVLQNQVLYIDPNWNYLFTWMDDKQKETFFYNKKSLPYIIHFTGPRKMWYTENEGLAQNLYTYYKHFTPWANSPLKSYQNKMRPVDYRVFSAQFFRKGSILKGVKFYVAYLIKKLVHK